MSTTTTTTTSTSTTHQNQSNQFSQSKSSTGSTQTNTYSAASLSGSGTTTNKTGVTGYQGGVRNGYDPHQKHFTQASKLERVRLQEWFTQIGVSDYEFTADDGGDSVDGFFTWGNRRYVIEAKNRKIGTHQYRTHPLESKKWEALRHYYQQQGCHPLFIIFTQDGAILYNLKGRIDAQERGEANGLVFSQDSRYPQFTVARDTQMRCTRMMAEIGRDEAQWKDRVYSYSPGS